MDKLIILPVGLIIIMWGFLIYTIKIFHKLPEKDKIFWLKTYYYIGIGITFVGIMCIATSLTYALLMFAIGGSILFSIPFFARKIKPSTGRSLEARVKRILNVGYVGMTIRRLWLKKVGGFISPALPFKITINSRWKKPFLKEAVIHEHVHSYYFIHRRFFLKFVCCLLGILAFISFLLIFVIRIKSFAVIEWIMVSVATVYLISALVYNEKVTFGKTNELGDKLGVVTRKWSRKIAFKYIFAYSIMFTLISTVSWTVQKYIPFHYVILIVVIIIIYIKIRKRILARNQLQSL